MRFLLFVFMCVLLFGQDVEVSDNVVHVGEKQLKNDIKAFVREKFINAYKQYNISINNLDIEPVSSNDISKFKLDKIIFDDKLLRKNSGNFEVYLYHNQKRQKTFFTFNISASIDAIVALNNIKTGEILSKENTDITQINIGSFTQLPVLPSILNEYSAKSFITNGSIITQSKITPKIIVKKGDVVDVYYNNNGVNIIFSAEALENGAINDVIKSQSKQGNRVLNIKILGPKQAQLY